VEVRGGLRGTQRAESTNVGQPAKLCYYKLQSTANSYTIKQHTSFLNVENENKMDKRGKLFLKWIYPYEHLR
jgi:hypothetical protein